jgi:internalin A
MFGTDVFDTVTYVRLQGAECGDDALRAACRLPWLEELIILHSAATDAGAEDLGRLTHLRALDLRLNGAITPRSLRHIGEMRELRELKLAMKLSPIPLRDEDMAFLQRLTKLQNLMLPSTSLTDAWLVYIEDLKDLKILQLYDMAITNDGLRHLGGLSNLTILSLHGTRVTSLDPLGPLTKLSYLCVAYTPVNDSALAALTNRPALGKLDLRNTKVTDAGVAELMRSNTRLKVTR